MNKKYIIKLLLVFFIVLMFFSTTIVLAANDPNPNFNVEAFDGQTAPDKVNNLTNKTLGTAISIARTVGVGVAVVILMVIAVKYMLASPGDRADLKKNAVPFVIGAVVLFGTSGILTIIMNLADTIKA